MNKHYRPEGTTETLDFLEQFCSRCQKLDDSHRCRIVLHAFLKQPDDAEFPDEWTYDEAGAPTCTAFEPVRDETPKG